MSEEDAYTLDPVLVKVGELLSLARTGHFTRPSIPALAATIGVDVKTVRSFENGRSWPQDKTRALIESALGLRPGWFVDVRDAITADTQVPVAYSHTHDWPPYEQYLGGPPSTEEGWEMITIRMRAHSLSAAVAAAIPPVRTDAHETPGPVPNPGPLRSTWPPNSMPPMGIPALGMMAPPGQPLFGSSPPSLTSPFQSFSSAPTRLPERGFGLQPVPQMMNTLTPLNRSSTELAAANEQLRVERDKTIEAIVSRVSQSTDTTRQILNGFQQAHRDKIDTATNNLTRILADLSALAATGPEPLAEHLRILIDHATAEVNTLAGITSTATPPGAGRALTTDERMKLAPELANRFLTAAQIQGQELRRGEAFELALAAIKSITVTTEEPTGAHGDPVDAILADPSAHGVSFEEHLDRWVAARRPPAKARTQGLDPMTHMSGDVPNRESTPRVPPEAEPCPPAKESDE